MAACLWTSVLLLMVTINFFALWRSSTAKDLHEMNLQELVDLGEELSQLRPGDVSPADINVSIHPMTVNSTDMSLYCAKVLIHGWIESSNRTWYVDLTDVLLADQQTSKANERRLPVIVLHVDWSRVARSSYLSSAANTKLVGEYLAQALFRWNLPVDCLHFVGHSLGAHVASFAARRLTKLSKKVPGRITALDPAGPLFRDLFSIGTSSNERLTPQDARVVDAWHTDAGFYGYEGRIGTVDVYVNLGGTRIQPGCLDAIPSVKGVGEFLEDTFCSHARSVLYFIEAYRRGFIDCTTIIGDKYSIDVRHVNSTGFCQTFTTSKNPYFY